MRKGWAIKSDSFSADEAVAERRLRCFVLGVEVFWSLVKLKHDESRLQHCSRAVGNIGKCVGELKDFVARCDSEKPRSSPLCL